MTQKRFISIISLSIAWIILFLLKGGSTIKDGWFFLFQVNKGFIGDESHAFSNEALWSMHNGVWNIIGITSWSVIALTTFIKYRKNQKNTV